MLDKAEKLANYSTCCKHFLSYTSSKFSIMSVRPPFHSATHLFYILYTGEYKLQNDMSNNKAIFTM
jgi:hypothetical protein